VSGAAATPAERLGRLEDPNRDFPFYNGVPVALSGRQWGLVLAAIVMGFAVLVVPLPWPGGAVGAMVPAVLFAALPLMALARVAPGHASVLFGRVGLRELRLMLGFALLNIVVSMSVGAVVSALTEVSTNAAAGQLSGMDTAGRVAFFARTVPQLLGEELVTVLPFLAILQGLTRRFGVGRRRAIVVAWLVSSLVFGLIHLPTYDWNLVQCVVIIGIARGVLTLPWILTKNLWVSTGAHIVNDWVLFTLGLIGAGLAAQA
jgi:uncharacterized protein